MIGRKSVLGIAVLCALAFSAFSVSSASATTAFTCVKNVSSGPFLGEHCLTAAQGGSGEKYSHTEIEPNLTTAIEGSNEKTVSGTTAAAVSVLAGTLSGVVTELQCTGLSGKGSLKNEAPGGVMITHGTGIITYTGCTVQKPAGKGCVVAGGTVTTKELTAVSEGAGTLAFKPKEGETFATITIEKCTVEALNKTFPVTGTLKGTVTGATTTTTEAGVTEQNTLKFGGNKAGLGGALTIRMEKVGGVTQNAIVLT